MNGITEAYLLKPQSALAEVDDYKVELPEFPLWWLARTKRNIEGLREIASHLHGKTAAGRCSRSGFVGEASDMDKQLIRNICDLEQQVYVLTDVLQSVIQIAVEEHERGVPERMKRAFQRSWKKVKNWANRIWNNPIFKVCGGLSTLVFVGTAILWVVHSLHK
jgi:hypothetical protein